MSENNCVTLTQVEMEVASLVGAKRRCESKSSGRADNYNLQKAGLDLWEIDIEGAAAEMAFCKFKQFYWGCTVGSFKGPDVGNNIQIRQTKIPNGALILREKDPNDDIYVLVVGEAPRFRIAGWARGTDGKNPDYIKDPHGRSPAWFVPQTSLRPIKPGARKS